MSEVMEQVTAAQKEGLATTMALAGIATATAEKVMDLNVSAIKSAMAMASDNSKALAEAKDVQDLTSIQSHLTGG